MKVQRERRICRGKCRRKRLVDKAGLCSKCQPPRRRKCESCGIRRIIVTDCLCGECADKVERLRLDGLLCLWCNKPIEVPDSLCPECEVIVEKMNQRRKQPDEIGPNEEVTYPCITCIGDTTNRVQDPHEMCEDCKHAFRDLYPQGLEEPDVPRGVRSPN